MSIIGEHLTDDSCKGMYDNMPWYKLKPHKEVALSGYPKMPDGCCHKTVVTRCKDCSFNKEPIDKK